MKARIRETDWRRLLKRGSESERNHHPDPTQEQKQTRGQTHGSEDESEKSIQKRVGVGVARVHRRGVGVCGGVGEEPSMRDVMCHFASSFCPWCFVLRRRVVAGAVVGAFCGALLCHCVAWALPAPPQPFRLRGTRFGHYLLLAEVLCADASRAPAST